MQCDTCFRSHNANLPFHCQTCAKNCLYEPRLDIARALLAKESAARQVEAALASASCNKAQVPPAQNNNPETDVPISISKRLTAENSTAERNRCIERTQDILNHAESLRKEIEDARAELARRKTSLDKRRTALTSTSQHYREQGASALQDARMSIKHKERLWDHLHNKTAESRTFLCREVAGLYDLRCRRRKKEDGTIREQFYMGGNIQIIDLRDLNNSHPIFITTCMTYIARVLVLITHYLSLRLPAEITLPQKNYPLPTIFQPSSSYTGLSVPFPGLGPSTNTSPHASRHDDSGHLPRPRPLYTDKKLVHLAKTDLVGYSLFLEGVSLLAWDVAWVCRSQGLNSRLNTWEDVCAIGRNLYELLLATPPYPQLVSQDPQHRSASNSGINISSRHPSSTSLNPQLRRSSQERTRARSVPLLGSYSHGTSHTFLAGARGTEYMRAWPLQTPLLIVDQLKAALVSEMTGAEWEMLEENEWASGPAPTAAEDDKDEEAVLVRPKRRDRGGGKEKRFEETRSIMIKPEDNVGGDGTDDGSRSRTSKTDEESGRTKGNSGWTKVKSRAPS
ncbi:MAG: hypothetical protein M1834_002742 [Cirrosporium novae-zelandiae]|nr:MAG: hypothetical protein M1834_002742 [Cirrosporium novae-zelandiae]